MLINTNIIIPGPCTISHLLDVIAHQAPLLGLLVPVLEQLHVVKHGNHSVELKALEVGQNQKVFRLRVQVLPPELDAASKRHELALERELNGVPADGLAGLHELACWEGQGGGRRGER
jgi:hypothetical protein